ncbi:hypothetical protein COL23_13455 [Priestia aryabhattai]|uniref:DUF6884 domain-containing protein n=1 Tax=Priestia aryabhattai TaxID=412384 RepID=UPI000BF32B87|nr:DUF6884 domain-containing protein [Priestia aryabhattai]PFW75837.1 hypothetical protein COL23_13455 [Priestia aryabhattai]
MKRIALVSCTKQKQNYPCEAAEMYVPSTLFKKIMSYIHKSNFDEWYILSAKYGLLERNVIISPYNLTLLTMKAADRKKWADNVFENLVKELSPAVDIYFFAGEKYRQYLLPQLEKANFKCYVPLKGMQIGEQLQFLNSKIK